MAELHVETTGYSAISDNQAKFFAVSIFSEVKNYIAAHRAEFEAWLYEEEQKSN